MTLNARHTRRRLAAVVLLTLLPWPAVWLGMYKLDNLIVTFALYHGLCLLPAALWGHGLWRASLRWPTRGQGAVIGAVTLVSIPLVLIAYHVIGTYFIDPQDLRSVVKARGFGDAWFWPLACYFVPVNATLEELFWRGVVLNELRGMNDAAWSFGAVWTALAFGGWHYLVLRLLLRHGWAEATVLGIIAAGVFLAWLYRRTGSILVPILWHGLVFDLALLVVFGAVLRVK